MGDGDGNTPPQPVKSYPPPRPMMLFPPPSPPQILNLVMAGAAATAGFLGYCEVAGILALLSLVFGFWGVFQDRDLRHHHHHSVPETPAEDPPPVQTQSNPPAPTNPTPSPEASTYRPR